MSFLLCNVNQCRYLAVGNIDGFSVCALHNVWQTRKILDQGRNVLAVKKDNRPIVLPCGPLKPEHLEPRYGDELSIHAWDDERLASVPSEPSSTIHPDYDLTRP